MHKPKFLTNIFGVVAAMLSHKVKTPAVAMNNPSNVSAKDLFPPVPHEVGHSGHHGSQRPAHMVKQENRERNRRQRQARQKQRV